MAKKVKEDTLNLEAILFKCRDILRQAKNSGSFFEKREQAILDHLQHFLMLNNLCLILIKGSLETDINRIKVVLGNREGQTNGWQTLLKKTARQFQNGVPIRHSLD